MSLVGILEKDLLAAKREAQINWLRAALLVAMEYGPHETEEAMRDRLRALGCDIGDDRLEPYPEVERG